MSSWHRHFSGLYRSVTAGLLRGDGCGVMAAGLSHLLMIFPSALWVPAPHRLVGVRGRLSEEHQLCRSCLLLAGSGSVFWFTSKLPLACAP